MSKNGPKIKELARELGVTARTLLDRCRTEGIPAQNSLTRLNQSAADLARAWFQPSAASDADPAPSSPLPEE